MEPANARSLMLDARADTEAVLNALPEALCVVDATERIALWSADAERLLGFEAIDLIDGPVDRIVPEGKRDEHEEMLALLVQGTIVRDRLTEVLTSKGRAAPVLLTAFPVRDDRGQPSGYGLLFREVAPMSEAQSRLALSARIESLGRLVASVGHEINNPCGFVLANVQHVRRGLEQAGEAAFAAGVPDDAVDALHDAEQGARRIRDLVASMKLFARGRNFERVPIDIRDVIKDAERLAMKDTPTRSSLWIDKGPSCTVLGDRAWLGQVMLNLILNAADAFSVEDPTANRISVYWETRGPNVELHVVDNGPGINAQDLEHIFDPFYTTKAPNRGVGLGLSICHDIVARHDGHIRARSEPERGTDICVSLPLARAAD